MDAVNAMLLLELTLSSESATDVPSDGLLGQLSTNLLRSNFADNPYQYYLSLCQIILFGPGLAEICEQVMSAENHK